MPSFNIAAFSDRIEKNQKPAAFAVVAFLFLCLHLASGVTEFYFDSGNYWNLSSNLLDFPDQMRGYFFPAILAPARFLSDHIPGAGLWPFKVLSSLFYAYALAILLPDFYASVFGGRLSFWRRMIVPALVAALFRGLILYPLSDLPAVMLMIGALYCANRSIEAASAASRRWFLILGGALAYGAYNTRTVFLFSMGLAAVAVPFVVYRGKNARTKVAATVLFLLGMALSSAPQGLINLKKHGAFWPGVINKNLFSAQLLWGIGIQRYETSINRSLPGPKLFYLDRVGNSLPHLGWPLSMSAYASLVLKNPVEFAGIYGRHIVSGLDVRDGEVYTITLSKDKTLRSALNFLIVFSGLAIMAAGISRNGTRLQFVCASAILLPVVLVIPGAVESRFFLPLHLAIYSALAFSSDPAVFRQLTARRWLLIALAFAVSAWLFFSVSGAILSTLEPRGKW